MESIIIVSCVGLAAGIIFSMPVWGPVSIFIATNGLKGRWGYCVTAAIGAGVMDFAVCFVSVLGLVELQRVLARISPYLFMAGGVVLFILGIRIIKARIDLEHSSHGPQDTSKFQKKNGFWAGLLLNASNPSIFFGWLTASFVAITFAASIGLNVGGMDRTINTSMHAIQAVSTSQPTNLAPHKENSNPEGQKSQTVLLLPTSICYAFSVWLGTVVWFSFFSYLLSRYRTRFRTDLLQRAIHGLGFLLCGVAGYFFIRGIFALVRG